MLVLLSSILASQINQLNFLSKSNRKNIHCPDRGAAACENRGDDNDGHGILMH